jgi:hypothetical protein
LTGSGHIWPDPGRFGQIRPEFGPPVTGCRHRQNSGGLISTPAVFRRPTIAKFWRSDIKHECKDEELNFGKRFTVLKIVNRFSKIKEAFTVKPKMIFVDHYFRPYQIPKNDQKSFYTETNKDHLIFLNAGTVMQFCLNFYTMLTASL